MPRLEHRPAPLFSRGVNDDGYAGWIICGHVVLPGRRGRKGPFPEAGYEGSKRPDNMRLHSWVLGQWNAEQSVFFPSSPAPCEELAEWRPVTWLFIRSHIRPCCMWNYIDLDWEHTSHLQKFDLTAGYYYWYCTVCFESLTLHRMRKRGGGALSRLKEMSRVCMIHFFHPFPVHAQAQAIVAGGGRVPSWRNAYHIVSPDLTRFCSRASSLNAKVLKAQGRVRCYLLPQSCPFLCILELNRIMPTDYTSL